MVCSLPLRRLYNAAMNRQSLPLSDLLIASSSCLACVEQGQSLTEALSQVPADRRSAVQAIASYALRHWGLASAWRVLAVNHLPKDRWLKSHVGLSLLLLDASMMAAQQSLDESWQSPLRPDCPVYATHTLVDQAVKAAQKHCSGRNAASLINAILRRFQRERMQFLQAVQHDLVARWNYPMWWIKLIRKSYPNHWRSILHASLFPPKLVLRVNKRLASVDLVMQALTHAGHESVWLGQEAIMLTRSSQVESLPGFKEGWWSVQDLSAQWAVPLLPLKDGTRVLDACAAPGGKTSHILERADVQLTALDQDPKRLNRIAENLSRLKLDCTAVHLKAADARDTSAWWDGELFDAILADVPCTASGVVRRHPDIAWLRRENDLTATVELQKEILDALWTTLAPGGHLLLVTCSVFPQEGERQAQALLQRHADAIRLPALGQCFPIAPTPDNVSGQDGFFYALFQRATS